jgi:hypothetical protein
MTPSPAGMNPGSPVALSAGCKCSPRANNYGEGVPTNGGANRHFTASLDCTMHNRFAKIPDEVTLEGDKP